MVRPSRVLKGENSHHFKTRLRRTKLLMERIPKEYKILDLGPDNILRQELSKQGFIISGTGFKDLDDDWDLPEAPIVTAFEIIEHLRNPYMVLKEMKADVLVASVPLNVWFNGPYWNDEDVYDQHYHEFYPKQFVSLLNSTGWKIVHEEMWYWDSAPLRPRPLLRRFGPWPSWMAVIAVRSVFNKKKLGWN